MRVGTTGEWKVWLWRGRFLWSSVALLAIGCAWLVLRCPRTQDTVRQLGLFYQVVGVGAAAWQLKRTAADHGEASLWAKTVGYLRDVPLLRGANKAVTLQGVAASASTGTLLGNGWGSTANDSLERQVAWLHEIVRNHEQRIVAGDARIESVDKNLRNEIERERAQREALRLALDQQIKKAATGTLDLALFGLFYILLGTLLSTATPELCAMLPGCR